MTAENTQLKVQIFQLSKAKYELEKLVASRDDEIETLHKELEAQQLAFDTQVTAYE